MLKKKLAAVAVVCAVLIGCEAKPCNPRFYNLGESVLIHKTIPASILFRTKYRHGCHYGYRVLLNGSAEIYFDQVHVFPKNEDAK